MRPTGKSLVSACCEWVRETMLFLSLGRAAPTCAAAAPAAAAAAAAAAAVESTQKRGSPKTLGPKS